MNLTIGGFELPVLVNEKDSVRLKLEDNQDLNRDLSQREIGEAVFKAEQACFQNLINQMVNPVVDHLNFLISGKTRADIVSEIGRSDGDDNWDKFYNASELFAKAKTCTVETKPIRISINGHSYLIEVTGGGNLSYETVNLKPEQEEGVEFSFKLHRRIFRRPEALNDPPSRDDRHYEYGIFDPQASGIYSLAIKQGNNVLEYTEKPLSESFFEDHGQARGHSNYGAVTNGGFFRDLHRTEVEEHLGEGGPSILSRFDTDLPSTRREFKEAINARARTGESYLDERTILQANAFITRRMNSRNLVHA